MDLRCARRDSFGQIWVQFQNEVSWVSTKNCLPFGWPKRLFQHPRPHFYRGTAPWSKHQPMRETFEALRRQRIGHVGDSVEPGHIWGNDSLRTVGDWGNWQKFGRRDRLRSLRCLMHVRTYVFYMHFIGYSDVLFQIRSNMKRWESPLPATPVPSIIDVVERLQILVKFALTLDLGCWVFGRQNFRQDLWTFHPGEDDVPLNSKMYGKLLETAAKAGPSLSFSEAHVVVSFSMSIETDTAIICNYKESIYLIMVFDGGLPRDAICWIAATFRWHRHGQQVVQRMQGWELGAMDPERDDVWCIYGVLNWFAGTWMCLCIYTYKYSNVCWVAILCHSIQRKWFEHVQHVQFQAAGIKDDAVHFACMVEAHAKAAVCSTSHFPPASTADKGSSSRLSCHVVLEKLKLNLKTLQRCLSLLPVTLRTTLHAFSTMKNSKILLDAAPDWKILGKAGELEEAQKWLQRTWGWHGLTWHSVDLAL